METSNSTSSTGDRPNDVVKNEKPWKAKYFFGVTFCAFALPGFLVSFPFLLFLLATPGVIIAAPILCVVGMVFFLFHRDYPEFHRAVCEGRIPQSTFARLLPFYLPLFYALIVMAVVYYRIGAHTHETVFFFLCAFPFYAAWTLFVAYLVTHYGVTIRLICLYLPHILSLVTALCGTYYILRYAPTVRHTKRDLFTIFFVTAILSAVTLFSYAEMRTRTLGPHPNVEVAQEEISMMENPTDLTPFAPFTGSQRLPTVETPLLEIREKHPKISAAFSLYPVAAAGVQTTYRDLPVHYTYLQGGTSPEAFHLLLFNSFDMAFMFRPSEKQMDEAAKAGKKLKITPIGREAFVFFVNKNNPIENLTTPQIRDIYMKRITNWKELGGPDRTVPDRKIMPFQRPEGSGSQTAMLRVMDGTPLPEPLREEFQHSMGGIITKVADYRNYENSLGYSFRFYVTSMYPSDGVKMIAVDGVEPTLENIRNGAYPFIDELCIVTAEVAPENTWKLIDWFLSPQGQNVIERVGYVPLNNDDSGVQDAGLN